MAGPSIVCPRRRPLALLVLLAGLALGGRAAAAEPGVLRIETIQSAPFGTIDAHGVSSGMTYEMGNLIAERAGLRPINHVVPYARTVVSLREGSADVVIRFGNDELGLVALQIGKVVPLRMALLSLAERPVTEFHDLVGETVAVARSAPLNQQLEAVPGIQFERVPNNEMLVRMLAVGRVRAAYGSKLGMLASIHQLELDRERFAPPLNLHTQDSFLHLSRRTATPALVAALRRSLESVMRDGSLEQIRRRYEQDTPEAIDPRR